MKLKISPCPNDTFIFYAMLNGRVDTFGMEFDVEFLDIEELNSCLIAGDGDIIKASAVMLSAASRGGYELLDSGAALGRGCGPIVVRSLHTSCDYGGGGVVALPGENTTAAYLFNRYFKGYSPLYVRFDRVAEAVQSGAASLGVLIHEGRFTYEQQGLDFVGDLGQMWEDETDMPIPLGGIYARAELPQGVLSGVINSSLAYAFAHPQEPMEFVHSYARELSADVLQKHIEYFVNGYTLSLGESGRGAFERLVSG